ncbi:flavodoxin family protein [Pseudolysinimonas sp.]|uniref:flavodoxin family protein n=1 Tax=Pseudolysinimonas sp. TaxID=2680009 RepID=UPI003F801A6F
MDETTPRALVAYESLFGSTRQVAEVIAAGMSQSVPTDCRDVRRLSPYELRGFSLLVIGAPTHARSLPTPASRAEGAKWLENRMYGRTLEGRALTPGMREWLGATALTGLRLTTFTTRTDLPRLLSGSALPAMARLARRAGAWVDGRGFEAVVDEKGQLVAGELDRAREWGLLLGRSLRRPVRA